LKYLTLSLVTVFSLLSLLSAGSVGALAQVQGEGTSTSLTPEAVESTKPQATPHTPAPQEMPTIGSDYVIGPEDVLRVDVFDVPELSNLVLRIANDGTITPPLLGHVKAAGLTPSQLRRELESKWGATYLQNPQVSVFVQEFHAQPVSIVGAVEKPGLYPLTGPRTLIEMLSQAGGLAKRSSGAAGRTVYVTRPAGFTDLQAVDGMNVVSPDKVEINLQKLLYSKQDALNIEIEPRDIISVSKAEVVYVGGNGVRKPGAFVLEDRDNVTVLQALSMAEGLTPNAARSDARIIRTEADGSRKMIPVNLKKVLKGNSPDLVLLRNDILFVPDSSQKALLKGGAQTVVSTLSWLLIYGRI
jgi:polysaccharide export outer membrane protein